MKQNGDDVTISICPVQKGECDVRNGFFYDGFSSFHSHSADVNPCYSFSTNLLDTDRIIFGFETTVPLSFNGIYFSSLCKAEIDVKFQINENFQNLKLQNTT